MSNNRYSHLSIFNLNRYVVLTSKHHEGYTLWPSRVAFSWNAMDVGSHRDLLGELADAVRAHTDLKFGLYHSLYEWYNPLWMSDTNNNHTTDEFVRFKTMPELFEIVNTYLPEIVWSDGEWEAEDTFVLTVLFYILRIEYYKYLYFYRLYVGYNLKVLAVLGIPCLALQ